MNEQVFALISAVSGAFIGGISSIAATVITIRSEYKRQKQSNWLSYKMNNSRDDRQKRIDLYIELLNIVGNISIEIYVPSDDINQQNTLINVDAYKKKVEELSAFCENNQGRMQVYFPNAVISKIMYLQREIYALSVDKTMISQEDSMEEIMQKLSETNLKKMQKLVFEIQGMIKEDLAKDCAQTDFTRKEEAKNVSNTTKRI